MKTSLPIISIKRFNAYEHHVLIDNTINIGKIVVEEGRNYFYPAEIERRLGVRILQAIVNKINTLDEAHMFERRWDDFS